MNKIRARPPPSLEAEEEYASSPCMMHEVDTSFGYWTRDEELTFLNELLKLERRGTKTFAEVGKAADLRVADLILEVELLQASWCVFIRGEIEARGGKAFPPCKKTFNVVHPKPGLTQTISVAACNQRELVETIQAALLKLLDPQLRTALVGMQKRHNKNIERLKDLLN